MELPERLLLPDLNAGLVLALTDYEIILFCRKRAISAAVHGAGFLDQQAGEARRIVAITPCSSTDCPLAGKLSSFAIFGLSTTTVPRPPRDNAAPPLVKRLAVRHDVVDDAFPDRFSIARRCWLSGSAWFRRAASSSSQCRRGRTERTTPGNFGNQQIRNHAGIKRTGPPSESSRLFHRFDGFGPGARGARASQSADRNLAAGNPGLA